MRAERFSDIAAGQNWIKVYCFSLKHTGMPDHMFKSFSIVPRYSD